MIKRLRDLHERIEKLKELEDMARGYTATVTRLLEGAGCSDARLAVAAGKLLEYQRLRAEAEAELVLAEMDETEAILQATEGMSTAASTAAILIARDVKGKSWEEIATVMLYSERQCKRLAKEGRRKLSGGRV